MHGAKRPGASKKNGAACESALRKNGQTVLWNCPGCDPQSFPALRGKTSSGAQCRSRRQLPPTRRSPSRASQRLTMCQRLLSTPVLGIKRIDQGRHRTCGADSSISSASFTTADDVSALSVDTLFLESSVSTQFPGGLHRQHHEDWRL